MCNRKSNIPSVKNPKLQAESIIFYFLYFSDSPKRLTFVHTLVWVIGLFGIFFIIAGHGHYTIDCLVAFYIASRIFTYHHAFANNRSLMTRDQKRLKKWFPVFYFFESNCNGIIPNEYESPVPRWESVKVYFSIVKTYSPYYHDAWWTSPVCFLGLVKIVEWLPIKLSHQHYTVVILINLFIFIKFTE